MLQLLATKISIVSEDESSQIFPLSILEFDVGCGDLNSVYGMLRVGKKVRLTHYSLLPFKVESEGLLLAEEPLQIDLLSDGAYLSMP